MKTLMIRLPLAISGGIFLILGLLLSGDWRSSDVAAYAPPGSNNSIPRAVFHEWDINEIFSCADGSIQFIEFITTFNGQHELKGHELRATNLGASQTHSFIFPTNSGSPTTNKSLLIATANLTSFGGVTPDFIIPANFLFTGGGTISLIGADTLQYGGGQPSLPLNGVSSLGPGGVNAVNSPKNFNGDPGSVICPASLAISKNAPSTVVSGSLMTYTLTVTSSGATTNTTVTLTDTIPASTTFISAEVIPNNGMLAWSLGNLAPPLAVVSRTFVVRVDAPGGNNITNSSYEVSSDQTIAIGSAVQTSVSNTPKPVFIYLPVILKLFQVVDEHGADLMIDSP